MARAVDTSIEHQSDMCNSMVEPLLSHTRMDQ